MQRWLTIVRGLLPWAFMLIPGLPPVLVPTIIQGIEEAQQLKGASGADKKAHVVALVELAITGINSKRKVIDEVTVLPVVKSAIDTGIALVNLFSPKPH